MNNETRKITSGSGIYETVYNNSTFFLERESDKVVEFHISICANFEISPSFLKCHPLISTALESDIRVMHFHDNLK